MEFGKGNSSPDVPADIITSCDLSNYGMFIDRLPRAHACDRFFCGIPVACKTLEELQAKFDVCRGLIESGRGKKKAEEYRDELVQLIYPK